MEDQEMDQYLESRQQNYMIDNMNAVAGCGGIGVADVGSGEILGGVKYDEQLQNEEHDVGDDDELKYVKEVQQSEKQQSVKDFGDYSSNELAENEEVKYKYEIGNGATGMGGIQDGGTVLNNGHESNKVGDQHMDMDGGESLLPGLNVLTSADRTSLSLEVAGKSVLGDDDEPCSLATNGTSSISENVSIPLLKDLEDSTPLDFGTQNPLDMDFEQMQSQLNPDAKEFVPNFGSSPSSPINPIPTDFQTLIADETSEKQMYFDQGSVAVPRHMLVDDDFLAQSPRKGRGDNMDIIALPLEQEFDEEADQRPHELEQGHVEPLEIGLNNDTTMEICHQVSIDDHINKEKPFEHDVDFNDFQTDKVSDHGPETCVDLGADVTTQQYKELSEIEDDVMKQSIYVANDDEPIEDVLNSVQPIPTEIDSANNSSTEELLTTADLIGDKELLQVEEKEHISNSPSTEEILIHMQCAPHLSNTDIYLDRLEINEDTVMQASFYLEQICQLDSTNSLEEPQNQYPTGNTNNPFVGDENVLKHIDTVNSEKDMSCSEAPTCGITGTMPGKWDGMTPHFPEGESRLLDGDKDIQISIQETGLEQEMSEIIINTDVIPPQTKDIASPFSGTTNENSSELFSTGDVDKFCEEIATRNEEIDTQQVNQETGSEMIIVKEALIEEKHTSPLCISTSSEDIKGSEPVAAKDMLPANHSEDFGNDVCPMPLTDNVESPLHLEGLSTQLSALLVKPETSETENNANIQHTLDKPEDAIKTNDDYSIKDVAVSTLLGPKTNHTVSPLEKQLDNLDYENNIVDVISTNVEILGEQRVVDDIAAEKSSNNALNADMVAPASIVTSITKNISPSATTKADDAKKVTAKTTTSTNASKSKISSVLNSTAKKTTATETGKKTMGMPTKPRLPTKTATMPASTDKKLSKPVPVGTTTARKILSNPTTATKLAPKVATTISAIRSTSTTISTTKPMQTKPIAASRTISSASAARKPAAAPSTTVGKFRPASASGTISTQAKTSNLGVSGTNNAAGKVKATSPRATLTSHLRKAAPATTGVKSPVKSTTTNNVTKTVASTIGNRTKPASSVHGTGSTTITKQFSARPAPKPTSGATNNTSTSTRRLTVGGTTTNTSTTQTTSKTTSTLRKSSPIKPITGNTPTKSISSVGAIKSKSAMKTTPKKTAEHKSNADYINKECSLNGAIATTSATEEENLSLPQSDDPIIANIKDPSTEGRDGGSTDHMNIISA